MSIRACPRVKFLLVGDGEERPALERLAEQEVLKLAREGLPVVIVNPSAPVGEADAHLGQSRGDGEDFVANVMEAWELGNLLDMAWVTAEAAKVGLVALPEMFACGFSMRSEAIAEPCSMKTASSVARLPAAPVMITVLRGETSLPYRSTKALSAVP